MRPRRPLLGEMVVKIYVVAMSFVGALLLFMVAILYYQVANYGVASFFGVLAIHCAISFFDAIRY